MKIEMFLVPPNGMVSGYISRKRKPTTGMRIDEFDIVYLIVFWTNYKCWISKLCNVKRLEKCSGYKKRTED